MQNRNELGEVATGLGKLKKSEKYKHKGELGNFCFV